MQTHTIEIKTEVIEKREVTFPFFSKNGDIYYKVESPDMQIQVTNFVYSFMFSITKGKYMLEQAAKGELITEEEFNEVYNKVKNLL